MLIIKIIPDYIFLSLCVFLFLGCHSEKSSDVKKIGFLKHVFLEYHSKNQGEIDSILDIQCLKKYPKKFQSEIISEFESGKIKLNFTENDHQYFIFWDHSDRVISLSTRGETKIKRKLSNHHTQTAF